MGLGEGWVVGGGAAKSWSVTLFLVLKVWHARAAVCIPSTHCICCSCVLYSCVHEVRICSRDFLFLFITPRPRTDQRNPAVEPRGGQSGSAVPRWTPAPIPTATTQRWPSTVTVGSRRRQTGSPRVRRRPTSTRRRPRRNTTTMSFSRRTQPRQRDTRWRSTRRRPERWHHWSRLAKGPQAATVAQMLIQQLPALQRKA